MTITLNHPSSANLRQVGVPGRSSGPKIMEIIATDDKPTPLPAYSGPAPPMHRIPPPDGVHGPPGASPIYEQPSWRPYPSSFDGHNVAAAEQRRPPLPSHGYPVHPNRELPQLPVVDGPYGRQASLPGPNHTPTETHPPPSAFRPSMNGAPHEPVPHSAPPEYRSRLSYPPESNGDPPPPAHSMPPSQYSTPVSQMAHTPAPYDSYQSQAYGIRQRKAARAQQACDQCRTRKAKCDEGRPACSHCKENNLICIYKEVPPHKQEKATQLVIDRLSQLEDKIDEKLSRLSALQVEQGHQLTQVAQRQSTMMGKDPQRQVVQRIMKQEPAEITQDSKTQESVIVTTEQEANPSAPATGEEALEAGEDGELSIPVEHTTAAHKLLTWPTIKNIISPHEYDEDYVMKLEEKRGLIRVYGRGEGDDTSDDTDVSTPSVNSQYHTQSASPSGPSADTTQQHKLLDNGVDENGMLMTDPATIRRYHQKYLDYIHKLHPFLDQNDLEKKIEQFIDLYCQQSTPGSALLWSGSSNGNGNGNTGDVPRGAKRKRSYENLQGAACDVQSPSRSERVGGRRIERSIGNAIILLVLAIGSICEVRIVPGPVTDTPVDFLKEQIPGPNTRSILSPAGSDANFKPQSSYYTPKSRSFPAPWVDGRTNGGSGRPAMSDNRHLRNLDVIPGLAFYAYATQILGSLQGANGLLHVQASLLAGLYAGQLAHPFQSHGWIYQAARACQVLVRSKRYEKMGDGPLKDLYDFAYWTCLQLESDILAELDLPASGISRSEARITLPKGRFTLSLPNEISAPSTIMMFFYSAQIHLRKVLNRVHTDLYKVEKQGAEHWTSNVQEILSMNLDLWRNSLPDIMKWKDNDPPSKDINVARMRAKYYGARYIIHRPVLYHSLHHALAEPTAATSTPNVDSPTGSVVSGSKSQHVSPSMTHSQRATNMSRLSSDLGPMSRSAPPVEHYRDLPTKRRRACKVCIDSAILSTEAFDGIEGRPVVTNIFGTAHAQFGNMLVLAATYNSKLSELVDRNDLERLLKRTISFLLQSQHISPSLRADARILTEIYEKIFGTPLANQAGSFSSSHD